LTPLSAESEGLDGLIAAEQDERRRIALYLHDGPVQQLAGIALMLDAALHSLAAGGVDDARAVLESALERQRDTIRELRSLSFRLEPVVLRDHGFAPALTALASHVGTTHQLRVDVELDGAELLGETAQVALYTIIRELLDQAVRRGPPSRVTVALHRAPDGGIQVTVADDAEPERRRHSFEAIEERVKQLHGRIDLEAGEVSGTKVVVTLPSYATRR